MLIYMLLAAQFESLLHPLVIMVSVPLASTGIVLSLWLTHRAFGLTAFIGVLMLVGIVVKNAILVVEFTNQLRERGYSDEGSGPARRATALASHFDDNARVRRRHAADRARHRSREPNAGAARTVVIGGLLFSTTLSLIVVPTLYLWVAQHVEPRLGGFHRGEKQPPMPTPELVPSEV